MRYVITKFSRMDSLPNFLTHGAPLARFARESSAKNAEKERKLIANGTPKSTIPLKKYSLEKFFWNGRMVGKQKSSTRALRIHNWQVLSATL